MVEGRLRVPSASPRARGMFFDNRIRVVRESIFSDLRPSYEGPMVDALASAGDEGRGKLR
jgi:hypothetical protein